MSFDVGVGAVGSLRFRVFQLVGGGFRRASHLSRRWWWVLPVFASFDTLAVVSVGLPAFRHIDSGSSPPSRGIWLLAPYVFRHVGVGPTASSFDPSPWCWVVRVVFVPAVSSLTRSCCHSVVVWPFGLSFGSLASCLGHPCRGWAVRVVLGSSVSSFDCSCRPLTIRVVLWPTVSSCCRLAAMQAALSRLGR